MRRYYLCPIMGSGTKENPYRPAIAEYGENWGMIDLRPDSSKSDGLAIAYLDSDSAISKSGIALLTDDLASKAKAIKQTFNAQAKVSLEAETLPDLIAELLIAPQRTGFCKPVRPMRDGKVRIYLGGQIWGEPEPILGKGTLTDSFNGDDSPTMGVDLSWTEVGTAWQVKSNQGYCEGASSSRAIVDTALSSDNHYSQFVIKSWNSSGNHLEAVVLTRFNTSNTYRYYHSAVFSSSPKHELYKYNGDWTKLGEDATEPEADHILKGQSDGSTIKVFKDTTELISVTDTDISGSTEVGVQYYTPDAADYLYIDDFEASELVVEKSSSDSGSGAESKASGNPVAALAKFETGSGEEGILTQTVILATSESGSGVESISGRDLVLPDSGAGADSLLAFLAAILGSETGSSVEQSVLTMIVDKFSSETGMGVEAAALIRGLVSGDGGIGSDLGVLLKTIPGSDGGSGCDALRVLIETAGSDMRLPGRRGQLRMPSKGVNL